MGDNAVTVIGLVVAGILGGITTWWSRRKLREAGVGSSNAEAIANLQLIADTWEERYNLEVDARVKAEKALSDLLAEQKLERVVASRDRVDLDNARSDIRSLERRRQRPGPRP